MKILISERQLGFITEQWWDKPSYERSELKKIDNQIAGQDKLGKVIKKLGPNLDADDYVDIVSGMIDVIPGIGQIASGTIDITHGITYVVRFFFAKTLEEKVEMAVMAVITLGMAAVPVAGNSANVVARGEIKLLMRQSPYEIRLALKNMGILKSAGFKLAKQPWKYSLLLAFAKVTRGQLENVIGNVSRTIASISNKSSELKPYLDNFSKEMNDVIDIIKVDKAPNNKLIAKTNLA